MTNQFNFLRFFAAFLVFYGHGFVLIGQPHNAILDHTIGLHMFFAISGYLISMSWDKEPKLLPFFKKRILRIFPALIFVVLFSVFVLGSIFTTHELGEYFSNEYVYIYLKNIFLHISYYLPGVFEHNPVPNAVNGSLWSLPAEFMMYILVAVIGLFGRYAKFLSVLIFLSLMLLSVNWASKTTDVIVFYNTDVKAIVLAAAYFWGGATIYHFNINRFFCFESFVVAFILLMFLHQWIDVYAYAIIIILPFLTLAFGFSESKFLRIFNKADYSYGIYIWAFPVQQSLYYCFPNNGAIFHLVIGFLITLFFAAFSWHCIEKPSLKLK